MKKVIIIGAGPAGLTAGYELLRKSSDYDVTIVEEASNVGGLCAKIVHNDKVLDAGGHMFISNNSQVKEFWNTVNNDTKISINLLSDISEVINFLRHTK